MSACSSRGPGGRNGSSDNPLEGDRIARPTARDHPDPRHRRRAHHQQIPLPAAARATAGLPAAGPHLEARAEPGRADQWFGFGRRSRPFRGLSAIRNPLLRISDLAQKAWAHLGLNQAERVRPRTTEGHSNGLVLGEEGTSDGVPGRLEATDSDPALGQGVDKDRPRLDDGPRRKCAPSEEPATRPEAPGDEPHG